MNILKMLLPVAAAAGLALGAAQAEAQPKDWGGVHGATPAQWYHSPPHWHHPPPHWGHPHWHGPPGHWRRRGPPPAVIYVPPPRVYHVPRFYRPPPRPSVGLYFRF